MAGADAPAAGGADDLRAEGGGLARRGRRRAQRLAGCAQPGSPAQLGGAAGTLAALGADGPRGRASSSRSSSSCAEPALPWHADRTRVAELGAALALDRRARREDRPRRRAARADRGRARSRSRPAPAAPRRCRTSATRSVRRSPVACARHVRRLRRGAHRERRAGARALARSLAGGVGRRSRTRSPTPAARSAAIRSVLEGLEVDAARMRANLDAHGRGDHERTRGASCLRRSARARPGARDRSAAASGRRHARGGTLAQELRADAAGGGRRGAARRDVRPGDLPRRRRRARRPRPRAFYRGEGDERRSYERGMEVRRRGARRRPRRPRGRAARPPFTADFQDLITRYAWGEIWTRPGLDRRDAQRDHADRARRARPPRGARAPRPRRPSQRPDATTRSRRCCCRAPIYCGVPAANSAFAVAQRVLAEEPQQ